MQLRVHADTTSWLRFENLVDWNTLIRRSTLTAGVSSDIQALLRTGFDIEQYADEQCLEWQEVIREAGIDEAYVLMAGRFELDVDVGRRRVQVDGVTPWMTLRPGEVEPESAEFTGLLCLWMSDTHELLLTLLAEPAL